MSHCSVMSEAEVLALSSGPVLKPESYNYRTHTPEQGGLYSEEVFGPFSRSNNGLLVDERRDRWGHIALAIPVTHPHESAGQLTHIPVVPPAYRQFRLQQKEELRARFEAHKRHLEENGGADSCGEPMEKVMMEAYGTMDADELPDTTWTEPELNIAYRTIVNHNRTVRRLHELKAPQHVLDECEDKLKRAVANLIATIEGELHGVLYGTALKNATGLAK